MLLLWSLSLAVSLPLPSTGEVVDSFRPCRQFFLDGKPPQMKPINPGRICQMLKNKYRFATMYDRDRRIPMFSAYKYQPAGSGREEESMIEPQLVLPKDHRQKSMELEENWMTKRKELEKSQAVQLDYKEGVLYDKGHLAPSSHQPDTDSKNATFTLTNIVPQFHQLNSGEWRIYEENINAEGCKDTYIIVGAVPGNEYLNDRVNIPSHIWAAGCCVIDKNKPRKSWGVIAQNNENKVVHYTLGKLQAELNNLYKKKNKNRIDLFNNACNTASGSQTTLPKEKDKKGKEKKDKPRKTNKNKT